MRRLLSTLLCLALAVPPVWAAATENGYAQEVASFHLDMPFVQHVAATAADMKAYLDAHPAAAKQAQQQADQSHSLGQIVANMEQTPAFNAILKKNGLTARQYVLGSLALMQAGVRALEVQKYGAAAWDDLKARGANTDNVHFYLDHQAELQKLVPLMQPGNAG